MDAQAIEATRIEPRQRSGHPALVQENQAFRSYRADLGEELAAPLLVGFRVALSGVERLFLRRAPI